MTTTAATPIERSLSIVPVNRKLKIASWVVAPFAALGAVDLALFVVTGPVDWRSLWAGVLLGMAAAVVVVEATRRTGRRRRRDRKMPSRFEPLARYNAEVSNGVVHSQQRQTRMAQLQREFDTWAALGEATVTDPAGSYRTDQEGR